MNTYIYESHNSKSFYNMAWIAFAISFVGMVLGIYYMDGSIAIKGFLAMAYLFSVSSCFTLAKVIRDKYESEKLINKVETAKSEKLISDSL